MNSLSVYAGPRALKTLSENPLRADLFDVLVGASGGPKWFVLYGLDRYLFAEFFNNKDHPLTTIGSSAGAWRLSCLGASDPVAAIERLATLYSQEKYSNRPTTQEISNKARQMLNLVLTPSDVTQILNNKKFNTHFIAVRGRTIISRNNKPLQALAIALCALCNIISRRSLSWFFERTIFTSDVNNSAFENLTDLSTTLIELSEENFHDALIASGSIPFVLDAVEDIAGAKRGVYYDGGISDYHLDLPFHRHDGLVLYPHFSPKIVPGWFDKHLSWRKPRSLHFENVLLICPSPDFVSRLPYGKIPDRVDFSRLDYNTRLSYWRKVLDESQRLADDFAMLQEKQSIGDVIQALKF